MCMGFSPACMSVNQIYIAGDHGSQKRPLTPWNWSYRQLWAAKWVLSIGFRSSGKPSVLLTAEPPFWPRRSSFWPRVSSCCHFQWSSWRDKGLKLVYLCVSETDERPRNSSWSIDDYKRGKQRGDSSTSGLFIPKRRELISVSPWPGVGSVCSFLFTALHLLPGSFG